MTLANLRSLVFPCLVGCAALAIAAAATQAGQPPTRFFDSAAREMLAQLQRGEGWAVVSERANVQLVPIGPASDCVKYRVVTNYKHGQTTNDQFFLEVEYSAETPWIALEFGMPKFSGTSLAAAKKANEIVGDLDTLLSELRAPVAEELDPQVRAACQQVIAGLTAQRAALVDLIQKDIQAIK